MQDLKYKRAIKGRANIHDKNRNKSDTEENSFSEGYNNGDDRSADDVDKGGNARVPMPGNFTPESFIENPVPKTNFDPCLLTCFTFIIIGTIAWACTKYINSATEKCPFNALHKRYPQNAAISNEVEFIASTLRDEQRTQVAAVYLLLHNKTTSPEPFINALAQTVAKCFDSEEGALTLDDFGQCAEDYGCVLEQYKMINKNVIVIHNLDQLPIETVHSLHFICDTQEPYIKPAFTFLTLLLPENYDKMQSQKNVATQELERLWSNIDKNERQALIARVTDKVHWLNA